MEIFQSRDRALGLPLRSPRCCAQQTCPTGPGFIPLVTPDVLVPAGGEPALMKGAAPEPHSSGEVTSRQGRGCCWW